MVRKIIHIDMDAFYASVEQRDHPELKGKPVVVGGRPGNRGVVAAASYEARRYGIRSAMPSGRAYELCPDAVFLKPRFDVYKAVSGQIREIFFKYTDLVEPLSLDEAFLDVTHNKKGIPSATWVAEAIRKQIFETTALTASAGVACNKFLAKIASDVNKPNGIFVIPPQQSEAFVAALPIGKFFGVGKATEKRMHELGIFNGSDLKNWSEYDLVRHFGKSGTFYYKISRGVDERSVKPNRIRKSVGVERTYNEDIGSPDVMREEIQALAEELSRRLKRNHTAGKTLTLKLRYDDFETITRARTVDSYLSETESLSGIGVELLNTQTDADKRKVRLLGLTVSNLLAGEKKGNRQQLLLPLDDPF